MTNEFDIDIPSLRAATGVSYTEAKMLQLLMKEEIATHQKLLEAGLVTRTRQLMWALRNKLDNLGITIVNDFDIGYSIPLKYKLRLKNIITGEIEDELNKVSIANRL